MDNELKQMLMQIIEGQEAIKLDVRDLKTDVGDLKTDVTYLKKEVSRLGAKIDGEISDKLKILAEEQSMMRKEISEINQGRIADRCMLQDIKL